MIRTVKLWSLGGVDVGIAWGTGSDITGNFNRAIEMMRPQDEWVWIMGDDHVWDEFLLLQLIQHDLDVVVPNVVEKQAPFKPVVYSGIDGKSPEGFDYHVVARLPATGVHEVFAAGSAGMLIRRHVIDALERPVFQTSGHYQNEDLNLCRKIREAGFKIHCDVDARMGHIGLMNVVPMWAGERWGVALETGGKYIAITITEEGEPIGAE